MALILVTFIIALAFILVVEYAKTSRYDQRMARRHSDSVQSHYILKSTLNLAQALLELPKLDGIQEDWLGEPWNLIAAAPVLPISGLANNIQPRLMIQDEDGKLDINALASSQGGSAGTRNPLGGISGQTGGVDNSLFWKNAVREVFLSAGFVREQFNKEDYRTRGNVALDAADQVAAIQDWIDSDDRAFNSASFEGTGMESPALSKFFYNRRLRNISELLLVPGFTRERLMRVAPFVRVSPSPGSRGARINVNTAPLEVLTAIGFPETVAFEMVQERLNLPITKEILSTLVTGDTQLQQRTKVTSSEYSVLARVKTDSLTRWLRAYVRVGGAAGNRRATVTQLEFY